MNPLRVFVFFAFGLFLLALVGVAACQRSLIYFPSKAEVAPTTPGVSVEHIGTSDGETLVAWYHAPAQQDGQRGPILLFFDGNGGAPEHWGERWRQIEAGGAGFLAVYYRGYSGSTGRPSERGLHEDARAGYDWLIAHGYAARDIVIDGYSLGSGVAVQLAAERPARALILEAPFTGIDDVARMRVPVAGSFVIDPYRSRDIIGRVHMPVLIVHGDRDSVIPFAQGQRLFALANEPKQFVAIPGADHGDLVREGLYDHVWSFLAQHPGS